MILANFKVHKTCRDKKFANLISSVERDATSIEQRKEKAIKNFKKFKGKKNQNSQRNRENETLVDTNPQERKKCISIGPIENRVSRPLKLSFTKDRDFLLPKQGIDLENETKSVEAKIEIKSSDKCKSEKDKKNEEHKKHISMDLDSNDFEEQQLESIDFHKIKSENDRENPHQNIDRMSFSGRAIRSNSKRSCFEVKLAKNKES